MCWIIRDVGIFLYGCVFAGQYIFFGQVACRPKELDAKRSLAIPPVRLTALKTFANHTMKSAKLIIFRSNNDPTTEEVDLDIDVDKSIPEQGVLIERKGQRSKVLRVNVEANPTERHTLVTRLYPSVGLRKT
jgi:hypothetical protein